MDSSTREMLAYHHPADAMNEYADHSACTDPSEYEKTYIPTLITSLFVASLSQAATLSHRYSFTNDASDAVAGADLTLNGAATINAGALCLPGNGTRIHNASANGSSLTTLATTITTASAITIEGWFTMDGAGTNEWSKVFMAGNGSNNNFLAMTPRRQGSGFIALTQGAANGIEGVAASTKQTNFDGSTFYMASVWDTTTDTITLYHQGSGDSSPIAYSASLKGFLLSDLNLTELYLGSAVHFGDDDYQGSIDELRIWDGALTQSQISANFAAGADTIAVPEPSTFLLLGLSALTTLTRRRRA
ncbi:LamG-like jellyroll fold domain-containing protein [Rubritalea tangerina]|uniref:LamG-like jellyroll fold domain-containing protein n=1 Tax=Rubritalea tangerina TaxID=430798 RepID=A0ABW4Z7Z2_9BACT